MYQRELYSTLSSAYSGYFDDISPPSAVAKPLLGEAVPPPPPAVVEDAPSPSVDAPPRKERRVYFEEADDCEDDIVYIRLTQVQFALLCMGAGIAVGIIISHRMRV